MLEINNTEKFNEVIETALTKAAHSSRWMNAIKKAVAQIEANGNFMTFDMSEAYLLIWSQDSDKVYTANGVCQCKAFAEGQPCWHRAAARLIRNYFGLEENKAPKLPKMENAPYLPATRDFKSTIIGRCRV
jgi:hypothetical protein